MRLTILMLLLCFMNCTNSKVDDKHVEKAKEDSSFIKQVALMVDEKPKVDSTITIDYLMGKIQPSKDSRFIKIAPPYASNNKMLLRKEAYESFKAMHTAAKKDGISLKIISATRPFSHQKRIWGAKWNGARKVEGKNLSKTHPDAKSRALKILEFSSMPGSSRHHWGTDIDINALTNEYFEKGRGKKEYDWLVTHAPQYGFCQPYSPKGAARPHGYNEEKWHWTFMPISKTLTEQYRLRIKNSDISGFAGSESAPMIDILNKYVLGISQDCL